MLLDQEGRCFGSDTVNMEGYSDGDGWLPELKNTYELSGYRMSIFPWAASKSVFSHQDETKNIPKRPTLLLVSTPPTRITRGNHTRRSMHRSHDGPNGIRTSFRGWSRSARGPQPPRWRPSRTGRRPEGGPNMMIYAYKLGHLYYTN